VPAAPFHKALPRAVALLSCTLFAEAARADVPTPLAGVGIGGSLAITSDYIYRGVSESDGEAVLQGDLHVSSTGGSFLGLWGSGRDSDLEPGTPAVLELYLGHRFDLTTAWSATLSARAHYYVGPNDPYEPSDDYQEITAAVSYLDRFTFSVTAIPNAVRYWVYQRLGRDLAWVADASGQYLIGAGVLLTGGAGYYYSSGSGTGIERATGYGYGNVGLAYEWRAWRVDVSYFFTQEASHRTYPYPSADGRVAATLAWRF